MLYFSDELCFKHESVNLIVPWIQKKKKSKKLTWVLTVYL